MLLFGSFAAGKAEPGAEAAAGFWRSSVYGAGRRLPTVKGVGRSPGEERSYNADTVSPPVVTKHPTLCVVRTAIPHSQLRERRSNSCIFNINTYGECAHVLGLVSCRVCVGDGRPE